jgi:hypothetical protein
MPVPLSRTTMPVVHSPLRCVMTAGHTRSSARSPASDTEPEAHGSWHLLA